MSIAIALGVLLVVLLGFRLATALIVRRAESAYPPAGQFVDVDGWRQHVLVEGEGPPVVLIHGDGGSIYDFTLSPLYPCLTARYRTFTVDRPGFGYSRRPVHGGGSPLVQASLIHDALAALGVEKPVVVGHARGAAVALAYALAYPNDLAAIVALAPAAYTHSEGTLIARLATMSALDRLLVLTVYTPAARFNNYALVRPILDNAFAPDMPTPPDYLRAYGAMWARPHIRNDARPPFSVVDLQGDRWRIEVPVVIVQAADRRCPRRMPPACGLARSSWCSCDTGHALMFTQPDAMLRSDRRAWEMAGRMQQGVRAAPS